MLNLEFDDEFGDISNVYTAYESATIILVPSVETPTGVDELDEIDDEFGDITNVHTAYENVPVISSPDVIDDIEVARQSYESRLAKDAGKKVDVEVLANDVVLPTDFYIAFDTEFNQRDFMQVLCVTCYIPHSKTPIYIDSSEIDDNFNLISGVLGQAGHSIKIVKRYKVLELINKYWKAWFPKGTAKDIEELKNFSELATKLKIYGLELENLDIYLTKNKKLNIKFQKHNVTLVSFYGFADCFKVFGQNLKGVFTEEAKLQQFRTIKIMGKMTISLFVDGVPKDFNIKLFDTRYVFPPIPASLDNQLKVYGLKPKIEMSKRILEVYGDKVEELWCKQNMDIVKAKYFEVFREYGENDAKQTWELYEKLKLQFQNVQEILEISTSAEMGETCGSNIQKILMGMIYTHFQAIDPENIKLIDSVLEKGTAKYLSKIRGNDYGVKPFLTTGGLLFTRTVNHSAIKGRCYDLDESSCYATAIASMNLYLGQPRVHTFFNNRPTLRDRLRMVEEKKIPRDAWLFVVSGKLKEAINTLVLSDLRFVDGHLADDYKTYSYSDFVDENKATLHLYDASKITEPSSYSKILTKEVQKGKITLATLAALSDLPESWYQEYLDLEVVTELYYDPDLFTNSIKEYQELVSKMPDDKYQVTDIPEESLGKSAKWIATKSNVVLVFPIGTYYSKIKEIRGEYKSKGDPIQEIFKLTLNSTYGIMASLVLKVNNPIAANWITSCARAAAWRMTNAINGFAPITDGTGFNLDTVPFGQTFRDILAVNPNYLNEYDTTITNDFPQDWTPKNEHAFNDIYIEHLEKFIGKSDWLTQMFKYELKDEKDKQKNKRFDYEIHHNTGAGNYVKTGTWGDKQKTRSYQSFATFTEWYKSCCAGEYKEHFIYVETELLQLSQGSVDAQRIIKDADDLIYRDKKSLKMTQELASQIVSGGISHPMGFSRHVVKLMKLISPSQFYYQDKEQFKVLDSLYQKLKGISKDILPKNWKELDENLLKQFYGVDAKGTIHQVDIRDYNYSQFNLKSPIGLGFEVLCFGNSEFNTINDVRKRIQEKLNEYKLSGQKQQFNLNGLLHITRLIENLKNGESNYLIHLLAATQIIKLNFEMDYRSVLVNSASQPTLRNVSSVDLTSLKLENDKI